MARPVKNNADYHSHDKDMRNDKKIKALRRKFGHEGYSVFNMMLELLTDSAHFKHPWDAINIELISADFDTDKLETIINYCIETLGLFVIENGFIMSFKHQKRMEPLLMKRERQKNRVIAVDNTQSKVKYSKVEYSKDSTDRESPTGIEETNYSKHISPDTANAVSGGQKEVKQKKQPKVREYWQAMVDAYHDFYKKNFPGETPSLKSRQMGQFADLYDRLRSRAQKRGDEWTEKHAVGALRYFLQQANSEQWLHKHFLLKNLVEQFDAVFARASIENKKQVPKETKPNSFDEDLAFLVNRYLDGYLNEDVISPDYYEKMISRGFLKLNFLEKFEGESVEVKKKKAVMFWVIKQAETKQPAELTT